MFRLILPILLISCSLTAFAQPSDFIVLKKRNNRTLKTYFPGTFISAATYTGYNFSGIIKQIKNDSVFIEQQDVRQVPTPFGVPALDTIIHTIRLHYKEIRVFYYTSDKLSSGSGMRRSFVGRTLPQIMSLGGTGFIILELVNTFYRGESLSDGNKLTVLAIAAGVAATGFLWQHLQNRNTSAGTKYKVVYVDMTVKKPFSLYFSLSN
jgi:hypothetical protein